LTSSRISSKSLTRLLQRVHLLVVGEGHRAVPDRRLRGGDRARGVASQATCFASALSSARPRRRTSGRVSTATTRSPARRSCGWLAARMTTPWPPYDDCGGSLRPGRQVPAAPGSGRRPRGCWRPRRSACRRRTTRRRGREPRHRGPASLRRLRVMHGGARRRRRRRCAAVPTQGRPRMGRRAMPLRRRAGAIRDGSGPDRGRGRRVGPQGTSGSVRHLPTAGRDPSRRRCRAASCWRSEQAHARVSGSAGG